MESTKNLTRTTCYTRMVQGNAFVRTMTTGTHVSGTDHLTIDGVTSLCGLKVACMQGNDINPDRYAICRTCRKHV